MIGPLARYNSIGTNEFVAAGAAAATYDGPLSGYLAGKKRGGYRVRKLEDAWAARLGVQHAIACNSATSGLFAAAHAIGLKGGDRFICSPLTMSATAAAPAMTGALPLFYDVQPNTFCLDPAGLALIAPPAAVFLTHLFGLAHQEMVWKGWCKNNDCKLIVDAAQSPFALDGGSHAGTLADIGVYSLNVHKHIQCGEGGICVTDDDDLAERLRLFINHGEVTGDRLGLNLRMTEVTAAIALAQLRRADELIDDRVNQAQYLLAAIGDIPGLTPQLVPQGCRHVYYVIAWRYAGDRETFVRALAEEGVPLVEGYRPVNRLAAFKGNGFACRVADALHDRSLLYFENCAYSPTSAQIRQIGDAFKKVAEHADRGTLHRA